MIDAQLNVILLLSFDVLSYIIQTNESIIKHYKHPRTTAHLLG